MKAPLPLSIALLVLGSGCDSGTSTTNEDGGGTRLDSSTVGEGGARSDGSTPGKDSSVAEDAGTKIPASARGLTVAHKTSCAINDGTVYCWGSAEFGHMGDGTRDENAHPTPMAMPYQDAVSVRLSRWANHVITKTGQLWVAGIDNHGQLPFETKTAKRVTGIDAVRDAAGSYNVGCILTEAKGEVLCRGDNALGEVGDGTTEDRNTYTSTKLSGVTSIAAGEHFFCAVSGSGKVPCWGDNSKGQMGDGQGGDGKTRKTPMGLSLPGEIVEVAAGSQHVCARTNDGDVYCWGINWGGQAGTSNGTQCGPHDCIKSPKKVAVQDAVALALADAASCAVLSNGKVQCWGESSLTEGAKALTDVVEIASGQEANHFCVRTSSPDEVLCWGDSDSAGQLGRGTVDTNSASRRTPKKALLP